MLYNALWGCRHRMETPAFILNLQLKQAKSPDEFGLKNFVICMSYKSLFHKCQASDDPKNQWEIDEKSMPLLELCHSNMVKWSRKIQKESSRLWRLLTRDQISSQPSSLPLKLGIYDVRVRRKIAVLAEMWNTQGKNLKAQVIWLK